MSLHIGEFTKSIDPAAVIHIRDPADTEALQAGDLVERWDRIFEWDDHCLKASQLEAWRAAGDPVCDAALRSMFDKPSSSVGIDLLERLESDAAQNPGGPSQILLEEALRRPPSDLAVSREEVREGQEFFLDNSVAIMQSLLHFSLAGGFSSPRITRVLQSVSYLVPPPGKGSIESQLAQITPEMNDRAYNRLFETFQFVLDVMGCTEAPSPAAPELGSPNGKVVQCLEPGGSGWKSALRVRLLHGIARRRIMDRIHINGYSLEGDGMPINQEDMAATLGSFSIAPLWCLKHLYCIPVPPPSLSQTSAFLAIWRHVGFYLGVEPAILRRHFASLRAAEKFLASTVVHLLTSNSVPLDNSKSLFPTLPILIATSNRPPFPRSFERGCALTRHVLGPSLASHLGVPPTPLRIWVQMQLGLVVAQIPVLFSHIYPRRGWVVRRRELTQEALARLVRSYMGMRCTKFRPRSEKGELDAVVVTMETVKPDPVGTSRLVREYRALMLEMAGVIAAVGILVIGFGVSLCALCADRS